MKDGYLKDLFSLLTKASNEAELAAIALKMGINTALEKKNQKYPRLFVQFGDDVIQLKNSFNFEKGTLLNEHPTNLEKLLYAISWKQGDVRKIKYVFDGLTTSSDQPPSKGITFWYFGKFLRDPVQNPIIDRNVILTYAACTAHKDFDRLMKIQTLTIKEGKIIQDFIKWYRNDINQVVRANANSRQLLDDILFCIGQGLRNNSPIILET